MDQIKWLENELKKFASKYYLNIFWQRLAVFTAVLFLIVFTFSFAEYSFWFDTKVRFYLFWTFVILNIGFFAAILLQPIFLLFGIRKRLSKQEFALVIGKHFPEIKDKIVNILELNEGQYSNVSIELLIASIRQKMEQVSFFRFFDAIDRRRTLRRLPLLIVPLLLFVVMGFTIPDIVLNPLERLSRYNTEYIKPAPFDFVVLNKSFEVAQNNDFTVLVQLRGNEIPEEVYIEEGEKRIRMSLDENNTFQYTYKSVKRDVSFRFDADGFKSLPYTISVFKMPAIVSYELHVTYPAYMGKQKEVLNNINSLNVPRGTLIQFRILTRDADKLKAFENGNLLKVKRDIRYFTFEHTMDKDASIKTVSFRNNIKAADSLEFSFTMIPDEYPVIQVREDVDSTMLMLRYFTGTISDDYGISRLKFDYRFYTENKVIDSSINININSEFNFQEFYNAFDFSVFDLKPGDKVEYFFTVYDNDLFGGPKAAKSQIFVFHMPTKEEMKKLIDEKTEAVNQGLENMYDEAARLQKELDDYMKKVSGKKKLNWEEQEKLKELLDREKTLEENIQKAADQNAEKLKLSEQMNDFNEQIYEKQQMINELMNQIMDDEFREMLEKLREMMEKNAGNMNSQLEKLNEKKYIVPGLGDYGDRYFGT